MADERIGLEVDVELAQGIKTVGDFRKIAEDAAKKVRDIGKAFGENSEQYKKAEEAFAGIVKGFEKFGDGTRQLGESKRILAGVIEAYGATSKQALAAASAVHEIEENIKRSKLAVDSFDGAKRFEIIGGAVQKAAGGLTALTGAMAILGNEGEETQKKLLQVQAALAFSEGLKSVGGMVESFQALGTVIKTQVVAAFATLKGAIIATGIGALIVAVGSLIEYFRELGNAAEEAAEKEKKALETTTKFANIGLKGDLDKIANDEKINVARAKNAGKSEKDILRIENEGRVQRREAYKRFLAETKVTGQEEIDIKNKIRDLNTEIDVSYLDFETKQKEKRDKLHNKTEVKAKEDPRLEEARNLNQQLLEENNKYRLTEEEQVLEHYRKLRQILLAGKQNTLQADIAQNREQADTRKTDLQTQLDGENKTRVDKVAELALQLVPAHRELQVNQTQLEKDQARARELIADQEMEHKRDVLNAIGGLVGAAGELLGQQTVAGKAFAIASTLISTYSAAQKAYESQFALLNPTSPILANLAAVTAIISGLARVKAIASVKVPGKGSGSAIGGGSLQTSSGLPGNAGQLTPKPNTTIIDKASVDAMGNQALKVFILEQDISGTQSRVQRIKRSAIFG